MRRVILAAAVLGGMAAGSARGADGESAGPFTRPAPLPPGEHALLPESVGPAGGMANAAGDARAEKPAFNLLGKPDALSPAQERLGELVMGALKPGNQSAAEGILLAYVNAYPKDQKALLLQATVIRSGLESGDAMGIFKQVVHWDGASTEGKAAKAMIEDADGRDAEAALGAYEALTAIDAAQPGSQTIKWLELMTAEESGQMQYANGTYFGSPMFASMDIPLMARRELADLLMRTDNLELGLLQWEQIGSMVRAGWSFRDLALARADCGEYAGAEAAAKEATDLEPRNVAGWLDWAQVLAEEGKTSDAAEELRKAGELEPQNVAVEILWGQTLLNAGDVAAADDHARRAIGLSPGDREAHTLLGRVLDKQGKAEQAAIQFEIAVQPAGKISEQAPALPKLLPAEQAADLKPAPACDQIMEYLAAGEQKSAREILGKLVKEYPDDQDVCFLNGVWLFPSIITDDQGKAFLAKAVSADRLSDKGKFAALMLKVLADRSDRASFDDLCGMVETHDKSPLYLWAGGIVSTDRGDTLRSLEFFKKLSNYFVVGPEIFRYQYSRALATVTDFSDALPHIEMSVHLDPGGWNQVELGWVLGHLRQFRDADAAFAKGLPFAGQFAYRWYDWGFILARWGHQEQAIEKYEQAIGLDPKNDFYFQKLRESLRALGKTEGAREQWQGAIALYRSKGDAERAKELQAELPKGN